MPYKRGKPGVYMIRNLLDGKLYIGGSSGTHRRIFDHKYQLRKNQHRNPHLQAAWNKDGEENFEFRVLLTCDESDVSELEAELIKSLKTLQPKFGYNSYIYHVIPDIENTPQHSKMLSKKAAKQHGNYDYILAVDSDGNQIKFDALYEAGEYVDSLHITKSLPYHIRMKISRAARGLDPKSPIAYNHTWKYVKH